jgi:hypothetical protein
MATHGWQAVLAPLARACARSCVTGGRMQGWRATWDLVPVVAPCRNGWELSALGFLLEFRKKAMNVYEKSTGTGRCTGGRRFSPRSLGTDGHGAEATQGIAGRTVASCEDRQCHEDLQKARKRRRTTQ